MPENNVFRYLDMISCLTINLSFGLSKLTPIQLSMTALLSWSY